MLYLKKYKPLHCNNRKKRAVGISAETKPEPLALYHSETLYEPAGKVICSADSPLLSVVSIMFFGELFGAHLAAEINAGWVF